MRSTTSGLPNRFSARASVGSDTRMFLCIGRKVVHDLLVLAHPGRASSVPSGLDDFGLHPNLGGNRCADIPLVVLRPLSGGDRDDGFRESGADLGLVAQVVAPGASPSTSAARRDQTGTLRAA